MGIQSKCEKTEERISKLKDRTIEMTKSEEQKEKRFEEK